MPNRPWTQEELDLLLSKKKVPTRSKKSIRRKLVLLGLKKPKYKVSIPHTKRIWTQQEIDLLKQGKKVPNRTKDSIRGMKVRLGIIKQKKNSRKPWKKKEEILLKKLAKEGKKAKEIFDMKVFKYSRNSIQKKMCYLGISEKDTIERAFWSKDQLNKLKKFLLENWEGKTPQELVDLWNEQSELKIIKNKVLYHLYRLKIKIPYYEVLRINLLRKKEKSIKEKVFKTTKILEENIRIERAEMMRRRLSKGRDIWTGIPVCVSLD